MKLSTIFVVALAGSAVRSEEPHLCCCSACPAADSAPCRQEAARVLQAHPKTQTVEAMKVIKACVPCLQEDGHRPRKPCTA